MRRAFDVAGKEGRQQLVESLPWSLPKLPSFLTATCPPLSLSISISGRMPLPTTIYAAMEMQNVRQQQQRPRHVVVIKRARRADRCPCAVSRTLRVALPAARQTSRMDTATLWDFGTELMGNCWHLPVKRWRRELRARARARLDGRNFSSSNIGHWTRFCPGLRLARIAQ